jgi:hypothetical protein
VVPERIHDFFLASGSVAGALIGLLFVAISVAAERLARQEAGTQLYRVRAAAALTAFTNALTVSLFALVPGHKIGTAALVMSLIGLVFVATALLSLIRRREVRRETVLDGLFLVGLAATFAIQLTQGLDVNASPGDAGAVNTIAILVIVCFLIGIGRAWELIGGPSIGITREVAELVRTHHHGAHDAAGDKAPESPPAVDQ